MVLLKLSLKVTVVLNINWAPNTWWSTCCGHAICDTIAQFVFRERRISGSCWCLKEKTKEKTNFWKGLWATAI